MLFIVLSEDGRDEILYQRIGKLPVVFISCFNEDKTTLLSFVTASYCAELVVFLHVHTTQRNKVQLEIDCLVIGDFCPYDICCI